MTTRNIVALMLSLILTLTNSYGQSGESKNADVLRIKESFRQINEYKDYKIITIDNSEEFLGNTTDNGGSLTGYYKGDTLKKIVEWVGMSNRVVQNEYYFNNGWLIFVYSTESQYRLNQLRMKIDNTKLDKTFEGRYYFKDEKILKTIVNGKGSQEPQDFFSDSKDYIKLLHAKRLALGSRD